MTTIVTDFEEPFDSHELKQLYRDEVRNDTVKLLLPITILSILVLLYYVYTDYFQRHSIPAVLTRVIPLILLATELVLQLISRSKWKKAKIIIFNFILVSLLCMMYAKCLIHLYETALYSSVAGTGIVVFLLSLYLRTDTKTAIIVYFLPTVLFAIIAYGIMEDVPAESIHALNDIYPMIILGYMANRYHQKIKVGAFKSNVLLKKEKQVTQQMYDESVQMNEKLHTSNKTKDKFFSIIAHDLRGPMNSIMQIADLYSEKVFLDEKEFQEFIYSQKELSQQTTYLLENLLNWAQLNLDQVSYQPEKFFLDDTINEIIGSTEFITRQKNIRVVRDYERETEVYTDKNMINFIIRNLVTNAVKFTEPRGEVTIRLRGKDHTIMVEVCDTGIGITQENMDKIMAEQEFFTTFGTSCEKGSGLGLHLCKKFIKQIGNELLVQSEPDKGSCFSFHVPQS